MSVFTVTNLHWGDYLSLGLYFVLVVGFGVWVGLNVS